MKHTLSKLSLGVLMASGLSASPLVMAEESPISANVSITSNYIYRGVPQGEKEKQVALQGGFDYAHDSGFYAGTWGSSAGSYGGTDAILELDYYAGFSKELSNGVTYDIGYLYYDYPGVEAYYEEAYIKLGYGDFGFQYSYGIDDTIADYLEVSYSTEFKGVGVGLAFGQQKDFVDYAALSFSKEIKGLEFGLTFISNSYETGAAPDGLDDETYTVLTVGKSF